MISARGNAPETDRPIVAFDFDGTLTVRDSFMGFLRWRVSGARYAAGLARLLPATLNYLGDRDRGRLKAAAAKEFLGGTPHGQVAQEAQSFARAISATLMRPDALDTWRRWGAKGALRVIVTASPELTVAPFARDLGADLLIGTRLALDGEDRVTGAFVGENCRAAEKVARLRAAFGPQVRLAAAYGDTSGDREMLELADQRGYRVFTARP